MNNYVVYCHEFPNGKRYVGITMQRVERRWRKGRGYAQNIRMTNAIRAFGWDNIKHTILYKGLSQEEAEAIEKKLITEWKLLDPECGYNYAQGGTHPQHTAATRKKIGEKSKGRRHSEEFKQWIHEKNSGSGNYMYGRHHTEETKRRISETKKGKSASPNKGKFGENHPAHKAVEMIDPATGNVVRTFGSRNAAAAYIKRSPSGISAALKGKQAYSGGYGWKYAKG